MASLNSIDLTVVPSSKLLKPNFSNKEPAKVTQADINRATTERTAIENEELF